MQILRTLAEMKALIHTWKDDDQLIGLVPTMGYLHEGHLALVKKAREHSDRVIVSIFVNPTQFGPNEDFQRYPRDEAGDLQKLKDAKTDAVFLPTPDQIYPADFQTTVHLSKITCGLCSMTRPGHFDGVATVVLKLFHLVKPDVAVFGEKDYQQLAMIRQMVKDLNLDLEILGVPTLRTQEGLALSSRNAYLSEREKEIALVLSQSIGFVQQEYRQGIKNVSELSARAKKLFENEPQLFLEYLEIVDAKTLEPLAEIIQPARVIIAARVGKTRLIDNGPVQP